MNALPVFKSITELPEFTADANNVKIVKEWQPIAKTFAAQGNCAQRRPRSRWTAARH